jgi:two-component system cell cycle sensor histidine kinase PleC
MSHELRTPLNAVIGFSEMIEGQTLGPIGTPRYLEYARDIHSAGSHLLSLISDILDVAKIETGKMEVQPDWLDARRVIGGALALLNERVRAKNQRMMVSIADDAPQLYADARAFKQILINLVSNAVKFTPAKGRITVRGTRTPDGGFDLCVEDNGPGIPAEFVERLFKPFARLDNRYDRAEGGTGLGLSLVRGLAELHGGRAWIDSDKGRGVRAHVYFPVGNSAALPRDERTIAAA